MTLNSSSLALNWSHPAIDPDNPLLCGGGGGGEVIMIPSDEDKPASLAALELMGVKGCNVALVLPSPADVHTESTATNSLLRA